MTEAIFRDSEGLGWQITINYGDILRVMRHVQTPEGKPVDLCRMAETGDITPVTANLHTLIKTVYYLLQPDIIDYTGMGGNEAQLWFYDRIDANALEQMSAALLEAIANFTPSPTVRAAIMTAGELMTKAQIVTALDILAGQLSESTTTQAQ